MSEGNALAKIIIAVVIGFFIFKTCTRDDNPYRGAVNQNADLKEWEKSPVDKLIKKYSDEQSFSVLLNDMDVDNASGDNPKYKHQYKLLIEKPDSVHVKETKWYNVSPVFFEKHVDHMGMEIASRIDGKVTKTASPAGYNNYVGDPKYGQWTQRNGSSFWEFYGKYAFLSSVFNMMSYPVHRRYWDEYRGGYYGTGRPYYGPSGRNIYGTKSFTSTQAGKNTRWGSKPSDFKNRVRSSVSRSAAAARSRSYSSGSRYGKTSRSASRSSRSTSFRSRSGGFGK
jgi:hypothetical protein